jgi:hypothetical protein
LALGFREKPTHIGRAQGEHVIMSIGVKVVVISEQVEEGGVNACDLKAEI